MARPNELDAFRTAWNREAQSTIRILESLPTDKYDFRPEPKGRSIGEMAWHLSEIDGCVSFGVAERRFSLDDNLPELARPRQIELLAPGYRKVHELAVARLEKLQESELDDKVTYFDGSTLAIRQILWEALLNHMIHHRAQLVLLARQAGGTPPGIYGPNREEMQAIMAKMSAGRA
jgi:uncharacterized damage-inducible protein DinB